MTDEKFMFYETFMRAIDTLPEDKRADACYLFCKYGIYGELPEDEGLKMFCIGVSCSVKKYQGRGGKREGAGRPTTNNQNNQNNQNEQTQTKTKTKTQTETQTKIIDPFASPEIEQIKEIYSDNCKNLIPINAYSLNRDLRLLIAEYLQDTNFDYEYFKEVCIKANKLQKIGDYKIDLKSVIKNHSGIYADKYSIQEEKENEYNPCL